MRISTTFTTCALAALVFAVGCGDDKKKASASASLLQKLVVYDTKDSTVVDYYTAYQYDAKGKSSKEITYFTEGLDGKWFTADDTISSYVAYTNADSNGFSTICATYEEGPDGIFFNSDDVLSSPSYAKYENDANGNHIKEYSMNTGSDYTINSNDTISSCYTRTFNSQNKVLTQFNSTAKGADGIWGTDDDTVSTMTKFEYDSAGKYYTKQIIYSGKGTDSKIFTDDDVLSYYYSYTRNSAGKVTRGIYYYGTASKGTDGIFNTADDIPYTYYDGTYDANNIQKSYYSYESKGTDGIWFTSDDVVSYYGAMTTVNNRNLFVYYSAKGTDGSWNTADDVVSDYFEKQYNGSTLIRNRYYNANGTDAKWLTSDDVVSYDYGYVY